MRFPFMKIAIYALTFLTYAYTGYGSNMISSLRDAIIAAEAIFGDVFQNVITIAKKFKVVHEVFDAAVEENCLFQCPDGKTPPVKNRLYTPSADGCGSLGLKINTDYLPSSAMETCCNNHDICYDTCNSDKELCDLDFKRCLYKICDGYEKSIVGDIVVKGCKGAAKMLFTGTLTLGCKSYLDSQKRSCYCPPTSNEKQDQSSSSRGKKPNYKYQKENSNNNKKPPKYGWKDPNDM